MLSILITTNNKKYDGANVEEKEKKKKDDLRYNFCPGTDLLQIHCG